MHNDIERRSDGFSPCAGSIRVLAQADGTLPPSKLIGGVIEAWFAAREGKTFFDVRYGIGTRSFACEEMSCTEARLAATGVL